MINPSDMDSLVNGKSLRASYTSDDEIIEAALFLLEDIFREQEEIYKIERTPSGERIRIKVKTLYTESGREIPGGPWEFEIVPLRVY